MSFTILYSYLVDGNGDYVVDQDGNRIIIDQFGVQSADYSTPTNTKARKAGSISAKRKRVPFIRSFNIGTNENRDKWTVKVNQKTLLGVYPSQATAIDALYGAFMSCNAADFGAWESIQDQLLRGISTIADDLALLSIARNGNEVDVTVEKFNYAFVTQGQDAADYASGVFLGYQTSTDGITYTDPGFANLLGSALTAANDGTDITETTASSVWTGLAENGFVRPIIMGIDASLNGTVFKTGNAIFKDEVDDTSISFTVNVQTSADDSMAPQVGGYAYAKVVDSSTLDPGESISFSYTWYRQIPSMTGITGTENP